MALITQPTLESLKPVLLSPVESYFWRFEEDLRGAFRVTVLFRVDGFIEPSFLAAALRQLQHRHPKLQASIAEGRDGRLRYQFEDLTPPIPFEVKDCGEGETPWREETRRLMQTDFPTAGPLAAVTVLRSASRGSSELLVTVPHAIADGLSAIMLMDDLLTEYAKAEAGVEMPPVPALSLVTAKRARPSGGWRGSLRLLRRFRRLKQEERRDRVTSLPEARDIPPQSQWEHWVFPLQDTLRLVRRCRKEQVSLGAALLAAVGCALMDCLTVPSAVFTWQLPFSVRESLTGLAGPVTSHDLGCFVSNMNGFVELPQKPPFWEVARNAHLEIQAFVEHGGPSFGYNIASFFFGTGQTVRRFFFLPALRFKPSSNKRATLLATNYGVLNMHDAYGSLRPRGCTLLYKNDTAGPSLVIEALVMGQQLNIGFAADDLDPAFWQQLHVAVRKHLDAAASAV